MSPETPGKDASGPGYRDWLQGPLVFIAVLVVVRFVLEAARVPKDVTRYVSASVGTTFVVIYLGAVAPLRGVTRWKQLVLPALIVTAWSGIWDALALLASGILRLPGSHFADAPGSFQNWQRLGTHVLGHLGLSVAASPIVLGLMVLLYSLHRWPVIVAPSAVLGGLVALRFAAEAMNFAPASASAWSSTVGVLLSALYLGGIGPRLGLASARQLLAPSLVLGWVWRFWVFLAAVFSASPLYRTHFFDPSKGRIAARLGEFFVLDVVVGFLAGLLVWCLAAWTLSAIRSADQGRPRGSRSA